MRHIHGKTQKHVIGVFPSAECDELFDIIDRTFTKCITIPFISDALDWCCGDGCKFSHACEDFLLMCNKQIKQKLQQKSLCKENLNITCLLGNFVEIILIFEQNIVTSKQEKR